MLVEGGISKDKIEIDFRMGVIWVEGNDDRIAEWQWKSGPDGGENTSRPFSKSTSQALMG